MTSGGDRRCFPISVARFPFNIVFLAEHDYGEAVFDYSKADLKEKCRKKQEFSPYACICGNFFILLQAEL